MRVATYNVHSCRGTDGIYSVERIAAVIRTLGASLVGLQEVKRRGQADDPLERLAAETDMQVVFGPTIEEEDGAYGNALLSRLPITNTTLASIGVPGREPRGILDATVEQGGRPLRVIVTHFGLHHRERARQVASLRAMLRYGPGIPTLLLGDFNEWRPRSPILLRLHDSVSWAPPVRSFPSRLPLLPLDRIWVRPAGALLDVWAHREPLARRASDHLPVCAALDPARLVPRSARATPHFAGRNGTASSAG